MELSARLRAEMLRALENVVEYTRDVEGGRCPPETLARRCVEALHEVDPALAPSTDVGSAIAAVKPGILRYWHRSGPIEDVDLEGLLARIMEMAGLSFRTPSKRLPNTVRATLLEALRADVRWMIEDDHEHTASRDERWDQLVDTLKAALLPACGDELKSCDAIIRRALRRPPIDLDPATSAAEQILRTASEELGLIWFDPPRRIGYRPQASYRKGDIVVHARFGEGEVLRVTHGKVEVRFADAIRVLTSGR